MMTTDLSRPTKTGPSLAHKSCLDSETRIVMIGKTGTGKSRTGNMILGKQEFHFAARAGSVTSQCWSGRTNRFEQTLLVTDTPGLWDTNKQNDEVIKEIQKCILLSAPGPHAILLIVAVGRFTEEDTRTVQEFQKYFGEDMINYLIVLFTKTDDLEEQNQTIQDYLKTAPPSLQELLANSNNRYIGFNNKVSHEQGEQQVKRLLGIIREMDRQNGGSFYTSEMFQEAEAAMQRRVEQIRREEEEKRKKELEELERKFRERVEEINKNYDAQLASLTESIKQLESDQQKKSEEAAELIRKLNVLKVDNQAEQAPVGKKPIPKPRPEVRRPAPLPPKPSRAAGPSGLVQARPEDMRAFIMKDADQYQRFRCRLDEVLQEREQQRRTIEIERASEAIQYSIKLREKARDEVKEEKRSFCSPS